MIFAIGPLAIRWYGLAYLAAFGMCWWLGTRRAAANGWSNQEVSDIVFYGAIGAVLGGRLGYVLFYGLEQLARDPLFIVRIWDGGMSFHGGLLAISNGGSGVQLVDVVEPREPRVLSRVEFPGSYPTGRSSFSDNRLLLVATDVGGLAIADVGNASEPQVVLPRERKMRITFP